MPNWVEQDLHVVGSKVDVDSFVTAGFVRRNKEHFDNLLDLHRLCPLKGGEPKTPPGFTTETTAGPRCTAVAEPARL